MSIFDDPFDRLQGPPDPSMVALSLADRLRHGGFAPDDEVADTLDALVEQIARLREFPRRIRNEIDHAEFNNSHLSEDSGGVGPGERVPAVRTAYLLAVLETTP